MLATEIHAIIAIQLLTTITVLIAMIWGKYLHLKSKITFFINNIGRNREMKHLKQTLILAIAKTVLIVTVSVQHMASTMPIHMVKTRSISNHYPI